MIDYGSIKVRIRNLLRDYIHPKQTLVDTTIPLSDGSINYEVAESFIPFSKQYSSSTPYSLPVDLVCRRVGSPGGDLVVSLRTDFPNFTEITSKTISATVIPTSIGTVSATLNFDSMLGSKTRYWLHISHLATPSTVNYYEVGATTLDKYWSGDLIKREEGGSWSTISGDLAFNCRIKNFIYENYPHHALSPYNFPRIAVDIVSRPRVIQRVIDSRVAECYFMFQITVYSRYEDELDQLISLVDKSLFKERINIEDIIILNPGNLSQVTKVGNVFARALNYEAYIRYINNY